MNGGDNEWNDSDSCISALDHFSVVSTLQWVSLSCNSLRYPKKYPPLLMQKACVSPSFETFWQVRMILWVLRWKDGKGYADWILLITIHCKDFYMIHILDYAFFALVLIFACAGSLNFDVDVVRELFLRFCCLFCWWICCLVVRVFDVEYIECYIVSCWGGGWGWTVSKAVPNWYMWWCMIKWSMRCS